MPISSLNPQNSLPSSAPADTCQSLLACPVSGRFSVFGGKMPPPAPLGHLKHRNLHGVKGYEQVVWFNLYEIELAAGNRAEEERRSRTAEFESRARSMGITGEKSIAEKVAIWEGMWAAGQAGNDIQYGAGILLDAATGADQ